MKFILLDAARMGSAINKAFELNAEYDSLYRGPIQESLLFVALADGFIEERYASVSNAFAYRILN